MSESIIIPSESRRRVRGSIMTFFGISLPGVATSVAVEVRDPNAFSKFQSGMGFYDGAISGGMAITEKLDTHGHHRSAQFIRSVLCIGHIGVAGVGANSVFERLQSPETASSKSLYASLGVAALSGAAILYERHKDKLGGALNTLRERSHELNRDMARRLFQTKLGESAFTAIGLSAQLATTVDRPTTGIAAIAAAGTFAAVTLPMTAQVKDEWEHLREGQRFRKKLRNEQADKLVVDLDHGDAADG